MKKMFAALSIALAVALAGCKDMMLNGNMREYLEFYTTTAILSKHQVQTESYTDPHGNLTVPSHQDAVVGLYTSNPKGFTLIPQFAAAFSNGATLRSDLDSYGLTVEQDASDLTRYTATIPSALLEELDLQGSGITLTVTPVEAVSRRAMPEYTFTLRSNTRPAFGSSAAAVMQTRDTVDGSKKWVLCFELPDLAGIHKDIAAVEINGMRYPVDTSAGQGAAALAASMGNMLATEDKVQVKDGGGVFFRPDVSGNGVYFITGDTIGTARTYTVSLIDGAGLSASLPPVSTSDTAYGKEIVSLTFRAADNPQVAALGLGDLAATISGTHIALSAPSALADRTLAPTITLSGGTVSPASGEPQDFSRPVTYTVTAGDGTTTTYTVSLDRFLPEPQLDPGPGSHTICDESLAIRPTNGLPAGTLLHYTVNGGPEQTADPAQGITLAAATGIPYVLECWFQCDGYETSAHLTGTYEVELAPSAITATVRSKDPAAQANETTVDGSRAGPLTHTFDGLDGSTVSFAAKAAGITLKVDGKDAEAAYDIGAGQTRSFTVTAYNRQGGLAARPVTYTVTASRSLPEPRLTPSVQPSGGTYTLSYPATELTMTVDTAGLPPATTLFYTLNGRQGSLDLSKATELAIPVGSDQSLEYHLHNGNFDDSATGRLGTFTVESRLPTPRLTPSVAESGGKYTVHYPDTSITLTQSGATLPAGAQLSYTHDGQTKTAAVTNGSVTVTLEKGSYTDFTYQYTAAGYTSSEPASLGTFTVASRLPTPQLTVSDYSSSSGSTYYTTTGSVTVRATNTTEGTAQGNIPSNTTLKYRIGSNGSEQSTRPSTGFTLDIQGDAYTVTAWYECSGYESSATTTKNCTVWVAPSTIRASASSKNGTSNTSTATGSTSQTSLTHNFYGVEGTTVNFSYTGSGTGISLDTTSASLCPTTSSSTTSTYTIYAKKNGKTVSDGVRFSVTSIMKPITFTLTGLSLYVDFDETALAGGNPDVYGDIKVDGTIVWSVPQDAKDWTPDPYTWCNPADAPTDKRTLNYNSFTCTSPGETVELWGNILEDDSGDKGTSSMSPTAATLYSGTEQHLNDGNCKWDLKFYFSNSQP